ncbi:glycogen synthase [Candidatus Bipolaricaulota bacterium]|nr:glycogen synthase [Candidatus Bipolaricaulota bacterium]
MRVLFASSEVSSFAKTGGLADVALALPKALAESGIDVVVVMPKYRAVEAEMTQAASFDVPVAGEAKRCDAYRGTMPKSEVPIYFLAHDPYFDRPALYGEGSEYPDALERFTFFSRGALALCEALDWIPDVIHINDWHTALIPALLRSGATPRLASAKTVLSIHNLGYQGVFPKGQAPVTGFPDDALSAYIKDDRINLLRGGILLADLVSTVSPTYAQEILVDGAGLEQELQSRASVLSGVVNRVDTDVWSPANDALLWATYSAEDLSGKAENKRRLQENLGLDVDAGVPVLGVISRLAEQKGFDFIMSAFDDMMKLDVQFVLLGTGAREYEEFFRAAQDRYPGRVASLVTFSEQWAHRIEAAADAFLMPSHYEPSGLNQQYSLLYGTAPIVRATGGLVDTVHELDPIAGTGNGFLFAECTSSAFLGAVRRAVDVYRTDPDAWRAMQLQGMTEDLSWASSARAYIDLYERALAG